MMKIEVRLFAGLKCFNSHLPCYGKDDFLLEVPDNVSLKELHELLGFKAGHVRINIVNGLARGEEWILEENDRVSIFPPVGGG